MKIFTIKNLFVALVAVFSFGVATAQESTTKLYIEPFSINAGDELEVEVLLDNPGDVFSGLQFDLYLPEGIEVLSDEDGYYLDLGSRTTSRKHNMPTGAIMDDGAFRIICYSDKGKEFDGESGDVIIITLKAATDLADGTYELAIKNVELVRLDETSNKPADTVAAIKVGTGITGIEEVLGEDGAVKEAFDLQGRKVETLSKGIYVVNGKKVLVK